MGFFIDFIVKIHELFEYLLLCYLVLNKLIKYIVMLSMTPSSRILNFKAPGSGALVLGLGYINVILL